MSGSSLVPEIRKTEWPCGDQKAARAAWTQARDAYLAYRQQGGYAQLGGGKLVDGVLSLLAQQKTDEVQTLLSRLAGHPDTPDSLKKLIEAIAAFFAGTLDPALADDPALNYDDAAEILFLLERLKKAGDKDSANPG